MQEAPSTASFKPYNSLPISESSSAPWASAQRLTDVHSNAVNNHLANITSRMRPDIPTPRTNETPQDATNIQNVYKRSESKIAPVGHGDRLTNLSTTITPVITNTNPTSTTLVALAKDTIVTIVRPQVPSQEDIDNSCRHPEWQVVPETCTDARILHGLPNESGKAHVLPTMNLHEVYQRGSDRIERAQNGWEIYDHYFTIHIDWGFILAGQTL
ncbi:hypothetical protein CKAH01_04235 [Colletotrichum kahawae]|uniref:Uncharacterized protein n=1 Tax=Colletotrichum kahawae TaxID=34407 RepID=A0AAD9YP35_COLKA|nr:hypothetical protein CKAH01_04235 [Colletotrichum kahawae]